MKRSCVICGNAFETVDGDNWTDSEACFERLLAMGLSKISTVETMGTLSGDGPSEGEKARAALGIGSHAQEQDEQLIDESIVLAEQLLTVARSTPLGGERRKLISMANELINRALLAMEQK